MPLKGHLNAFNITINIPGIDPKNPILVDTFQGTELINDFFSYQVTLHSSENILNPASCFNKLITFTLTSTIEEQAQKFYRCGYITNINTVALSENIEGYYYYRYEITVAPKIIYLNQHIDCRVYTNKTPKQILEDIFKSHGFDTNGNDIEFKLSGPLSSKPYEVCAQFEESDLSFILRIIADAGMFFYFRHDNNKGIMVICDKAMQFESTTIDGSEYIGLNSHVSQDRAAGFFNASTSYHNLGPKSISSNSFNIKDPNRYLQSEVTDKENKSTVSSHPYFGHYISETPYQTTTDNKNLAQIHSDRSSSSYTKLNLDTNLPLIAIGCAFTTSDSTFKYVGLDKKQKKFVITGIRYNISAEVNDMSTGHTSKRTHNNHFSITAIPFNAPAPRYNSQLVPPSSISSTLHQAVVVTTTGETKSATAIANEMGMPYIGFHWDQTVRDKPNPEKYTPIITTYSRPSALFDVPHPGEIVKIKFSSWKSIPYLDGVVGDMQQHKIPLQDIKNQTAILSRPESGKIKQVNQLLLDDTLNKQKLNVTAPGCYKINAATANGEQKPLFSLAVDDKGNLTIEAATITLKTQNGDITMNSSNNITANSVKETEFTSGADLTIKAKGKLSTTANATQINDTAGTQITSKQDVVVKGNSKIQLKAIKIESN